MNTTPSVSNTRPAAVVFFGSDAIALPLLRWLDVNGGAGKAFVLCGVVSQPDRKSGRGQKLQPNPISAYALEAGLPLLRPEKPDEHLEEWLRAQQVELALVMAYGHMLKNSLLQIPSRGFVNFHASLLPKYRGASPVETAVACGETQTGVSLMQIIRRMDAGAVLDVERVPVDHATAQTGADTRLKLAEACVPLIARNIGALLDGSAAAAFTPQEEADALYCRKLDKSDGQLDFSQDAASLAARINGLFPWPGCFADYGEERLKLAEAFAEPMPEAQAGAAPGTILSADKSGLLLATADGALRVRRMQKAGGKLLESGDFLSGTPLEPGHSLSGSTMQPLTNPQQHRSKDTAKEAEERAK